MTSKQKWVLALASVSSLMVALDVTVVATALGTMRQQLHASIEQLEWTVNAYGLSFAVLLMTASALGDRFGRRNLYAAGMGLFVVASAACALAPDVGWLIAARAVQGAGAAVVAPMSLSLLSAAFPPERRGSALGIFGGITGIAVLAGPVLGGAVTQGMAWEWIFWLNVPIGLAAIPLVLARIDESFGPPERLDVGGLVLVTGAALGLVWGLVRGNPAGWGSVEVLGALIAGVVLTVAFVIWEMRVKQPMLPMRLFANRAFAVGNASGFLLSAALFSAVFFMAQFQQTTLGQSPLDAGLRLLPWTGTVFFVAPLSGSLVDRIGERPLLVTGLAMQAAGFIWVALIAGVDMSYGAMIPALILAGSGVAMAIPAAQNSIVSSVAGADIGKASGTFSTGRQLGGAFGLAIAVAVFTGAGSYVSPGAFSDGFVAAVAVSGALSLAGAAIGSLLPARSADVAVQPGSAVAASASVQASS
ncbi:MAG: DHA2 family efflux MFS transporter permease subunit [Solirubrobacteraceae bacterium]|jgi:EmrB/QacA subfamily drug resistance transporter